MAITLVGAGAFASGTAAITPALPSGWAADDLLICFVETAAQAVTTPSGWSVPANAPQSTGAAAGTTSTALYVFYKKAAAGEAAPSIADPGDHADAFVIALRGVDWTNGPFDVTAGDTGASSTSVTFPSVTTTVADDYIVLAVANATDSVTAQGNATATNAALTGLAQIANGNTNSGNGGGIALYGGSKASAGATGTTSTTLATASVQARMTLAVRPYVAPPPGTPESLFYPNTTPPSLEHNDSGGVTLTQGTQLYFTQDGQVTGIAFWWANDTSAAATTGTVGLYDASGTLLASKDFTGLTGSAGWRVVDFDAAVNVSANVKYIATYYQPRGSNSRFNYGYSSSFGSSAYTSSGGHVVAPANGSTVNSVTYQNGRYGYNTLAAMILPANTFNNEGYFVDVVFSTGSGGTTYNDTASEAASTGTTQTGGLSAVAAGSEAAATGTTQAAALAATAAATEAVSTTDAATGTGLKPTAVSEALSASDSASAVLTARPAVSEASAPDATQIAESGNAVTVTEAAATGEGSSAGLAAVAAQAETLQATETRTAALAANADASEAVAAAESQVSGLLLSASATEALAPADGLEATTTPPSAVLDAVVLTDAAVATLASAVAATEAVGVLDSVSGSSTGLNQDERVEALDVSAAAEATVQAVAAVTEAADAWEAMGFAVVRPVAVSEALALDVAASVAAGAVPAEHVAAALATDRSFAVLARSHTAQEAVALGDVVTVSVEVSHIGETEDRLVFTGRTGRSVFTGHGDRQVFE